MKIALIDHGYTKIVRREHYNDAGADVFAMEDTTIEPHSVAKIDLGFGLRLPDGYMACIFPKSGQTCSGIIANLPPIDSGYTGSVHALVSNITDEPFNVSKGSKIGQLVVLPIILPEFVPEDQMENKESRGAAGFGSTGNN